MLIKTITLHDIELDAGSGKQIGHLIADFCLNRNDEAEFHSNVIFQPFGNNAEELPEQVLTPEEIPYFIQKQMLEEAEETLHKG